MKKILSVLLALTMCIVSVSISAFAKDNERIVIDSGYVNWSLNWTLYSDGILQFDSDYTWTQPTNYSETNLPPWHKYNDKIKEVVFECTVDSVGDYAFYECSDLEKVTFPSNVPNISVGAYSFYNCSSIKSIILFGHSSTTTRIGEYAFGYCSSLEKISIPSNIDIENYAFKNCGNLKTVYFYDNNISKNTFSAKADSFSGIKAQVLYPYGEEPATDILKNYGGILTWKEVNYGLCGRNANWFYDIDKKILTISGEGEITYQSFGHYMPWGDFSTEIANITVSEGIDYIPSYAFESCRNLETIELPRTLKCLATNAFNTCEKLNNILLPDSIEVFEYTQFNRCDSLTDLYYLGTEEEWNKIEGSADISKSSGTALKIHFLVDLSNKPTCMQGGEEIYYQFDKTDIYGDLYDINKNIISKPTLVPLVDHSYTNYISNGDATCTSYGTKTAYCDFNCGNSITVSGDKLLEHTYTSQITKQPTHKEGGIKTFTCECGDTYTELIEKIPHSYSKVTTAPSCTLKGYTTYTCDCGDSYVDDYTDAIGHSHTSKITTPATHLTEGVKTYTCDCGDTYTESITKTKEHTYTVLSVVAPSCEKDGYTMFVCECGESYNDKISATGHNYEGNYCVNCGESKTDNCSCNCHKGGFNGFIWKLLRIFYKLFGMNKTCACGMAHY